MVFRGYLTLPLQKSFDFQREDARFQPWSRGRHPIFRAGLSVGGDYGKTQTVENLLAAALEGFERCGVTVVGGNHAGTVAHRHLQRIGGIGHSNTVSVFHGYRYESIFLASETVAI